MTTTAKEIAAVNFPIQTPMYNNATSWKDLAHQKVDGRKSRTGIHEAVGNLVMRD
jgi:hypothetical protein